MTSLAIWLSFEFANKEYQCIFGKCDNCCLKCAKCAIEKIEQKQQVNKLVGTRFIVDVIRRQ